MLGAREIEFSSAVAGDLTTSAAVKAALNISGSSQDTEIAALIKEASAAIETYCSAIFKKRTVTERLHLEEGGPTIVCRYSPASNLTAYSEDGDAKTLGDFRLNSHYGMLRRVDGGCHGVGEILITYDAGYADADIPPGVSRAALELCVYNYQAKFQSDDVARESVPDAGDTTYRDSSERTLYNNGVSLPARIALMLAPFKVEFFQ